MTRGSGRQQRDAELLKAIETQTRLRNALKLLFELLETYSPLWYEKRHHDQARAALYHVIRRHSSDPSENDNSQVTNLVVLPGQQ